MPFAQWARASIFRWAKDACTGILIGWNQYPVGAWRIQHDFSGPAGDKKTTQAADITSTLIKGKELPWYRADGAHYNSVCSVRMFGVNKRNRRGWCFTFEARDVWPFGVFSHQTLQLRTRGNTGVKRWDPIFTPTSAKWHIFYTKGGGCFVLWLVLLVASWLALWCAWWGALCNVQNLWVQCETPELRFVKCSI
jgi:hypothetical protein